MFVGLDERFAESGQRVRNEGVLAQHSEHPLSVRPKRLDLFEQTESDEPFDSRRHGRSGHAGVLGKLGGGAEPLGRAKLGVHAERLQHVLLVNGEPVVTGELGDCEAVELDP